jgi:DNA-binding MarR family transcriptional regulator
MRSIRAEMRSRRTPDLSVPQFRVLTFLNRHPGSSLSEVADHIGLTPPSMSKIIDGLVSRALITRQDAPHDRRRVHLVLTALGKTLLEAAYGDARMRLAEMIAGLSQAQYQVILESMETLRPIFNPDPVRLRER